MSTAVDKASQVIKLIKEKDPDLPVIIGGPHCTLSPSDALQETQADICIQGDGENVIVDLIGAFHDEERLAQIHGIYYQTKKGIAQGPPFIPIGNLDSIPFPARHLIKHYLYGRAYNPSIQAGEFTSILTSRGCPFNCKFCSRKAISLNRYRTRSSQNIIEELQLIHQQGYKYLGIMDDSALYNKKQAHEIFDALIKEQLNFKIYITASRADSADPELYRKMRKAGVVSVQFGLESGSQEILDYYDKKTTVHDLRRAVIQSHEAGFFTSGTFVLGAPFETKKDFQRTLKFAQSLPLNSASFLPLRYRSHTDIWNDAVKEGYIDPKEYEIYADSARQLGMYSKKELLKICERSQILFYARPKYFKNLIQKSLKNNDYGLLKMLLTIFVSSIKEKMTLVRTKRKVM
jgi:anaerobic magnesium-protoporphyrin IX monomethyl ester cyclase